MKQKLIILFLLLLPGLSKATDLRGRLGLGATNQLANGLPALSLKIQQSKTFAIGGVLGFKSDQDKTLYGAGVKFYRIIFDEPQLNFYMAGLLATQKYSVSDTKTKGGLVLALSLVSPPEMQTVKGAQALRLLVISFLRPLSTFTCEPDDKIFHHPHPAPPSSPC